MCLNRKNNNNETWMGSGRVGIKFKNMTNQQNIPKTKDEKEL
jgi:hypothetical protein